MSSDAGLDVSYKAGQICVVDADGKVLQRDVVARDPDVLAKWLARHCADLVRVVLETGMLSTFLYHGLAERGVAVECIAARARDGLAAALIFGYAEVARAHFRVSRLQAGNTRLRLVDLRLSRISIDFT